MKTEQIWTKLSGATFIFILYKAEAQINIETSETNILQEINIE
jgi:hypothetical protein